MRELVRASLVLAGASALALMAAKVTGIWEPSLPSAPLTASLPPILASPPMAPWHRGFVGVLLSQSSVDISPRLEGSLQAVRARIGDPVRRGDLLATLDARPVHRELQIVKARLAAARAEASRAEIEHDQAVERAERANRAAQYLNPEETSAVAYAVRLAVTRRAATEAQAMEQEARVAQLVAQIADCELRSPIDGVVADRLLDSGAVVDRRSVVMRIVGTEAPRVRFAVPEEAAGEIRPEMPIRIEVLAAHLTLRGTVEAVAPQLDPASRTLLAEGVLDPVQEEAGRITTGAVLRVFPGTAESRAENLGHGRR